MQPAHVYSADCGWVLQVAIAEPTVQEVGPGTLVGAEAVIVPTIAAAPVVVVVVLWWLGARCCNPWTVAVHLLTRRGRLFLLRRERLSFVPCTRQRGLPKVWCADIRSRGTTTGREYAQRLE